jgi:tetratricopeptide (TPR) repeat protein
MYRGRYASATAELREAVLLNRTGGATVSELRDRMFLVGALDATGSADANAEIAAVDRIAAKMPLGPEWLEPIARVHARRGQVADARRLLATMVKTAADATSGSSSNRSDSRDTMHLERVRGEIALAERRPAEAVDRFEAARVVMPHVAETLESLATALIAARRVDEAVARYQELLALEPFGNEGQDPWLRAHVRAGELLERLGRRDEARQLYERLLALWRDGDRDLVLRKEAQARLAAIAPPR